jgi:hypothetical protein
VIVEFQRQFPLEYLRRLVLRKQVHEREVEVARTDEAEIGADLLVVPGDRRDDVSLRQEFRQRDFKGCARDFPGLDEDELVLMRNDHEAFFETRILPV